jgi:hypothetical protein
MMAAFMLLHRPLSVTVTKGLSVSEALYNATLTDFCALVQSCSSSLSDFNDLSILRLWLSRITESLSDGVTLPASNNEFFCDFLFDGHVDSCDAVPGKSSKQRSKARRILAELSEVPYNFPVLSHNCFNRDRVIMPDMLASLYRLSIFGVIASDAPRFSSAPASTELSGDQT